ncbi:MAG: glycosyltransferase family 1 protein [Deltaproteobacteria bacterium]|nr:glycosyltransferase family 1 protein [Deltaproteobacteria bacterium]
MQSDDQELRDKLARLGKNLAWAWDAEAQSVFRDLDPVRWEEGGHDPTAQLAALTDADLETSARAHDLHPRVDRLLLEHAHYLERRTDWGPVRAGVLAGGPVAYFSAEFGLHESLPIYSGGLGVLSGDHVKSASDLGVPLVAVGLLYAGGYFTQHFDETGWQHETYPTVDPELQPLTAVLDADGEPLRIHLSTREGDLHAGVWEAHVGRVRLFLLDSDVLENDEQDRGLTARLYGGDRRMRARQELLLGVGGVRALHAMGIRPAVFHLNEGHSAFAPLEAARELMEREGRGFHDACFEVASRTVFTTHTPVPAGHDRFDPGLVEQQLGPLRDALGISEHDLFALGRVRPDDGGESFCMTVLALKLSHRANGVSALHGRVSRKMWTCLWPGRPEQDVPIGHITNGVHLPTWLAPAMARVYDEALPLGWRRAQAEPETWAPIEQVDDRTLWTARTSLKEELIRFVRHRSPERARKRGEDESVAEALESALSADRLLIGFARRFATYKRAGLVLDDLERLDSLVNHPQRPLTLVFAGKAHPKDDGGKALLQRVFQVSRDPRFVGKVVLLEGYDMAVGRKLVSGVDVWLNNPRRPLEASGTSGQKVVLNGGLNCSIPDGWWAEAYDGHNGFSIGTGGVHMDPAVQDARDAVDLMHALEEEVVPLYYDRDQHGLPHRWLGRVRRSIATLSWRFNSDRMVRDYAAGLYLPAAGLKLADFRHL